MRFCKLCPISMPRKSTLLSVTTLTIRKKLTGILRATRTWNTGRKRREGFRNSRSDGFFSVIATLEQIKARLEAAVPGTRLEIIPNDSPAKQPSLLVDTEHALAVARFLRDDPQLQLDYASNMTGVDWLDTVLKEKVKVK